MFRRRRDAGGLGIVLLALQLFNVGIDNIPTVTLGTILFQAGVFLGFLRDFIPGIAGSCISLANVFYYKQWQRIFFSAVVHGDDMHLYFNMISFLWKGKTLEPKLGSKYFAYLLAVFTVATQAVLLLLNYAASEYLEWPGYYQQCAVGFSGVIFALKVLSTYQLPPGVQYVMFIPIHSRLVCWAELVLIQLMVPNASFTGHLAGILVGMAYVHGPLRVVMDTVYSVLSGDIFHQRYYRYDFVGTSGYRQEPGDRWQQQRYYRGGERSGRARDWSRFTGNDQPRDWSRFTGGLSEEEQLRRATFNSTQPHNNGSPYPSAPSDYSNTPPYPSASSSSAPYPSAPSGSAPYPSAPSGSAPYPNAPSGSAPYPSAPPSAHHNDALYPDLDELRRRRNQRYS